MVSPYSFVFAAAITLLGVHFHGHCASGIHSALPGHTPCTADVAADIVRAHVCDGRVGARKTNACSCFIHTINPELLKDGVSSDLLESKRGEDEGLHAGKC